jgi:uncharacterized protein YdeI (YjbR/CyaY-like superfamily)
LPKKEKGERNCPVFIGELKAEQVIAIEAATLLRKNKMRKEQASRLKRPVYPMPDFIHSALLKHGLLEAYQNRPAYQQNDYSGWITRAKQQTTREKRVPQMLEELATGDRSMKMAYTAKQATE